MSTQEYSPRKHERLNLSTFIKIFYNDELLGFLINASPDGIQIISNRTIDTNRNYSFNMEIPERFKEEYKIESKICFNAHCIWLKNEEKSDEKNEDAFFITGFKLLLNDEEVNKVLQKIFEAYKIKSEPA